METENQEGTSRETKNDEGMDFEDFITNDHPFNEVPSSEPKNDLAMEIDLLDLPGIEDKSLGLPEDGNNILEEIEKIVGDVEKGNLETESIPVELEQTTSDLTFDRVLMDDPIDKCDYITKESEKIASEKKVEEKTNTEAHKKSEEDKDSDEQDYSFVEKSSDVEKPKNEIAAEEDVAGKGRLKSNKQDKADDNQNSTVADGDNEGFADVTNKDSHHSPSERNNVESNVQDKSDDNQGPSVEGDIEGSTDEKHSYDSLSERNNVESNVQDKAGDSQNSSVAEEEKIPKLHIRLNKEMFGAESPVEQIIGMDDFEEIELGDDETNRDKDVNKEITTPTDNQTSDKDKEAMDSEEIKSHGFEDESLTGIATVSMEDFQNEAMQDDEASDPFGNKEDPKSTQNTTCTGNDSNSNTQTGFIDDQDKVNNETSTINEGSLDGSHSNTHVESTKYNITHYNANEVKSCGVCKENLIPKFLAKNNAETIYICENDCLIKFKEDHADEYVEKILRLRAFAVQEKETLTTVSSDNEEECIIDTDDDSYEKDQKRKCATCKRFINLGRFISWEALDFCKEACILKFQRDLGTHCKKCEKEVSENLLGKYCVRFGNIITQFCSTSCLLEYKKVFKFCAFCQEDIGKSSGEFNNFCSYRCSVICQSDGIPLENGECAVCHQNKPIEIKYKTDYKVVLVCSFPCYVAYKFVNNIDSVKCVSCILRFDMKDDEFSIYKGIEPVSVCSQECQKIYLIRHRQIVVCVNCAIKKYDFDMISIWVKKQNIGFTCSNTCLRLALQMLYDDKVKLNFEPNINYLELASKDLDFTHMGKSISELIKNSSSDIKPSVHRVTITKPKTVVKQRNIATMCKPNTITKSIMCKRRERHFACQTDDKNTLYVPIPVPIHVTVPLHMYVDKVPLPVPIPIPLPVPIFIPTNRKSVKGIKKEINKIKNKIPADPLEAEILMMADMAAGNKKDDTSSGSDEENTSEVVNTSFSEDVLSMALKMANEMDETVDPQPETSKSDADPALRIESIMEEKRKNIRQHMKSRVKRTGSSTSSHDDSKSDAHLTLRYTFGVNAWKQWVTTKNSEIQKSQKTRRPKLFKTELLQLNSEDLNIALSLFVKEVRKPNGSEYAPDTIYYLCLGIQQYLYENGRVDHLFCDPFYEKFTDSFNEVCLKFASLYSNSQYIVTRVEEEHLWESKQLGAHSPLVLLNTLMFFNTKHFSLTTVKEHLQLSFSHIMKHWKRNPVAPGCRNVLLRFYPPQKSEGGKKRRVFEQQENEDNPLRCPVKLYEFYLSKCPESVKTRNDVFYLQPERSCVPDSPVWYSTMAMATEPLEKMLNRVKMIKEINISLLTVTAP